MADPLPDEIQRKQLCELMYIAFMELRYLRSGDRSNDLAYAFHNLPKEIYGWGTWSIKQTRDRFLYYQKKHPNGGADYVALFDKIFPCSP